MLIQFCESRSMRMDKTEEYICKYIQIVYRAGSQPMIRLYKLHKYISANIDVIFTKILLKMQM